MRVKRDGATSCSSAQEARRKKPNREKVVAGLCELLPRSPGQVESTIDKGTMIVRLAYRIPAENVGEY